MRKLFLLMLSAYQNGKRKSYFKYEKVSHGEYHGYGKFTLFDTDILIDVGRTVEVAVKRLEAEERVANIGISVVTQMELIVGCRNKNELNELDRFLK